MNNRSPNFINSRSVEQLNYQCVQSSVARRKRISRDDNDNDSFERQYVNCESGDCYNSNNPPSNDDADGGNNGSSCALPINNAEQYYCCYNCESAALPPPPLLPQRRAQCTKRNNTFNINDDAENNENGTIPPSPTQNHRSNHHPLSPSQSQKDPKRRKTND